MTLKNGVKIVGLSRLSRMPTGLLGLALLLPVAARTATAQGARSGTHRQIAPPSSSAEYVLPDGSIYVAGNDLVEPFLTKLNAAFTAAHPGFRFKMDLISSGLAVAGITAGKSAFGPTARDVTDVERAAFASRFGYAPLDILVGWDNNPDVEHYPPGGKFPPGVWVNTANPTPALSLEQLAGILLAGSPHGDITRWGQIKFHEGPVGNNGEDYAKRQIHIYMPVLHGLPVVATTRNILGVGLSWSPRVEYLPGLEDVINAVANDPFGIGLAGWFPVDVGWDRQQQLGGKVRLLPLSETAESHVSHGLLGDLYPLAGGIHLMVNRKPGEPLEPWLRAYLELALSSQGQDILRELTRTDGFLALSAEEVAEQRAKLQ